MTRPTLAQRNEELLQLVEACCNGTITDDEFARLEERLREDAAARVFYRRYTNLHSALQEYGDVSGQGWYAASLDELNRPSWSRRAMRIATASAAVCLVIAAGLLLLPAPPAGPSRPSVGRLESVTGTVTVATAGAAPRIATEGEPIRTADTILTLNADSVATMTLFDGSRFTLRGKSTLTCDDNALAIHRGGVVGDVVPQPDRPPVDVTTPHHRLSVREARFELLATDESTTLTVTAGRVAVTRLGDGDSIRHSQRPGRSQRPGHFNGDGKSVAVTAGQRLVSRAGSPFKLENVDAVVWSADFEHGLPRGWRLGRFVKTGLPRGSAGGVEAVTARVQEGVYHSIAGPERWNEGLFRFDPALHVQVTLKMSQPGWINIFLFTKKNQPGKPEFAGNYLFNETPFLEMKPGRWYSLTVPIGKFRRLFPTNGGQFDGAIPYQIALSSKGESRGLVVDELRIARGGPGRVELKELK